MIWPLCVGTIIRMKIRLFLAAALTAISVESTLAQELSSEYTTFDRERDCAVISKSVEEGDWADFVCPGYRGYPILIRYGDGRETVTYGYATEAGMPNITPFNEANGTVEWRILTEGETAHPFAAIQRWHISHSEGVDDAAVREILVVSRVGQPMEGEACAVAFLSATGNPNANQDARDIADSRARDFTCGSDRPDVDEALENMVAPPR